MKEPRDQIIEEGGRKILKGEMDRQIMSNPDLPKQAN